MPPVGALKVIRLTFDAIQQLRPVFPAIVSLRESANMLELGSGGEMSVDDLERPHRTLF